MKTRKVLYADEGKVLTNGTDYTKISFLAEGADGADYHEITLAEYDRILREQEENQV